MNSPRRHDPRPAESAIRCLRFKHWSDVNARCGITIGRDAGAGRESQSVWQATCNYYLGAAKQFCRWMVWNGRSTQNPLEHLRKLNAATDRKRERRTLIEVQSNDFEGAAVRPTGVVSERLSIKPKH